MKNRTFKPGDRVAMSAAWGKSTGASHATMARRGTVIREEAGLSRVAGKQFVVVAWDGEAPFLDGKTVLANNLAKVGSAAFGDTYA